jgi:hypothetical protein
VRMMDGARCWIGAVEREFMLLTLTTAKRLSGTGPSMDRTLWSKEDLGR